MKTPYSHISSAHGDKVYMERFWLFNPYPANHSEDQPWWRSLLPSIRLHHILLPDMDRHMHDHPWNARTIILDGMYIEKRLVKMPPFGGDPTREDVTYNTMTPGSTATLNFGEYHSIETISESGVWTMFITWKY